MGLLAERHRRLCEPKQTSASLEITTAPRDYRKELWIQVAARTAGSSNCNRPASAGLFANVALADFDKAFGQ